MASIYQWPTRVAQTPGYQAPSIYPNRMASQVNRAAFPTPQQADAPAASPWDNPNYQEPTPPPASMYQGQGAAMGTADTQQQKASTLANNAQQGAGQAQQGGAGVLDVQRTDAYNRAGTSLTGGAPNPNLPYGALPPTPTFDNYNPNPVTNSVSSIKNSADFGLTRQAPLTQNGQIYEDQNLHDLQTGKFGDVESARNNVDRQNALRTSGALQATRGALARGGEIDPLTQSRAQESALAGADASNLNATNGVNQLQRQYSADALTRANQIESDNQTRAVQDQNYKTTRADLHFNQDVNKGTYADNRSDLTNANMKDAATFNNNNKSQDYLNKLGQATVGDNRLDKVFSNSMDVYKTGIGASQFDRSLAQSGSQFDKTFGETHNQNQVQNTHWDKTNLQGTNQDFLTSVPEGKTRNAAQEMLTSGMSKEDVAAKLFNPDGSVKPEYQEASIGTKTAMATEDQIRNTFKPGTTFTDENGKPVTVPTDPAGYDNWIKNRVAQQGINSNIATNNPVNTTVTDAQKTALVSKLKYGATPEDVKAAAAANIIPPMDSKSIVGMAGGDNYKTWAAGDGAKTGGYVKINNTPVKIVGGGKVQNGTHEAGITNSERANHIDYTEMEINGKDYWLMANGAWLDTPPKDSKYEQTFTSVADPTKAG